LYLYFETVSLEIYHGYSFGRTGKPVLLVGCNYRTITVE
jgi:hypothetical protein